ncbi:hypothetical protein SAMN04490195_6205 [Pseudomonas moorei]|uniref:Uncharacterized protein n=1 Tax=Pseudomonas moorei TaxID=395599 RepID=A0A1H1JBH7_9PSED|nr:hypothetical protein SAMN04490195_6205 [Pseudomonas moorei]
MSEVFSERIVAHELRFDIDARQAELIDREHRDLFFAELIEQRDRYERMPRLLHRFVEQRTVFGRQVQQVDTSSSSCLTSEARSRVIVRL